MDYIPIFGGKKIKLNNFIDRFLWFMPRMNSFLWNKDLICPPPKKVLLKIFICCTNEDCDHQRAQMLFLGSYSNLVVNYKVTIKYAFDRTIILVGFELNGRYTILKRTACAGQVRAFAVRYLHEPLRANFVPPAARNPFEIQSWNYTHVIM